MKKFILTCFVSIIPLSSFASEALVALGERLFNDERFSENFYQLSKGDVNFRLEQGSKELQKIEVNRIMYESPFKDSAMTCASCHMVDHGFDLEFAGMRGYNDFAVKTPLPFRVVDGKTHTLRNTPTLVGIGSKYAQNRISHMDGEFFDHSSTVLGNFTGRNMGWLSSEKQIALDNIIAVLKGDNGSTELAQEFGGSYSKVLLGIDPSLTDDLRLEEEHRLDLAVATDSEIINAVVKAVTAYMDGIDFEADEDGNYTGSPYDKFLELNNLPRGIEPNKDGVIDTVAYTRELISKFSNLKNPKFVSKEYYPTQKTDLEFGEKEWKGLKVFFNISKRGMCINCHMAPMFTDQIFHNVGTTQVEYDGVHGEGSFAELEVPDFKDRGDKFYLANASSQDKELTDLGLWNWFGRSDKRKLTQYIKDTYCGMIPDCDENFLLPRMKARFKTPTVRNLGHSGPYMHNGSLATLEEVMQFYIDSSNLLKEAKLVNGAPQLHRMNIDETDIDALVAFLNALNENYE